MDDDALLPPHIEIAGSKYVRAFDPLWVRIELQECSESWNLKAGWSAELSEGGVEPEDDWEEAEGCIRHSERLIGTATAKSSRNRAKARLGTLDFAAAEQPAHALEPVSLPFTATLWPSSEKPKPSHLTLFQRDWETGIEEGWSLDAGIPPDLYDHLKRQLLRADNVQVLLAFEAVSIYVEDGPAHWFGDDKAFFVKADSAGGTGRLELRKVIVTRPGPGYDPSSDEPGTDLEDADLEEELRRERETDEEIAKWTRALEPIAQSIRESGITIGVEVRLLLFTLVAMAVIAGIYAEFR